MTFLEYATVISLGAAVAVYFWYRDKRQFTFPEEPGVYRVSVTRNQSHYNLYAYFDGMWWHEAKLTREEALMSVSRAKRGYYWALCKQV